MGLSYMVFIVLRFILSRPNLLRVFITKGKMWNCHCWWGRPNKGHWMRPCCWPHFRGRCLQQGWLGSWEETDVQSFLVGFQISARSLLCPLFLRCDSFQFWRLAVQGQGVGRFNFCPGLYGRVSSRPLPWVRGWRPSCFLSRGLSTVYPTSPMFSKRFPS